MKRAGEAEPWRDPEGNGAEGPGLPPRPRFLCRLGGAAWAAGLRATSDAASQDETDRSQGRKANGGGGARLPDPRTKEAGALLCKPPPAGEGFKPRSAADGRGQRPGSGSRDSSVDESAGRKAARTRSRPLESDVELRKEYVLTCPRDLLFLPRRRFTEKLSLCEGKSR